MNVYELNMDGLVGPTHNYAGLAAGNVASVHNALQVSNPKAAALQGLEKMRLLHHLGLKQGVLPPHQRPNLALLHQLGFSGNANQQINKAYKTAPELLSACYSASSMWTANAATVAPSTDTLDHKLHFTAANLISNVHRYQEAFFSKQLLEVIFANPDYFHHHPIVPSSSSTGDEGAANHNRLCHTHAKAGIHLFVYGKQALGNNQNSPKPKIHPARQTKEASETIMRLHQLDEKQVVFACQNPLAIDAGVFHNDVIAVANEHVFLVHEQAFINQTVVFRELQEKANFPLTIIELSQKQISIEDAVATYLFNSQLVSLPEGQGMILLAPSECENNSKVANCINELLANPNNPIQSVHYLQLKQSMRNGGGPACLRLRIPVNDRELKAMHQGVLVDDPLIDILQQWVLKHYRDELHPKDLADPLLMDESFFALDELTHILKLGALYPFQKEKTSAD